MCDIENHMVLDGPDAPWNAPDASCDDCGSTKRGLTDVRVDRDDLVLCDPCIAARRQCGEEVHEACQR